MAVSYILKFQAIVLLFLEYTIPRSVPRSVHLTYLSLCVAPKIICKIFCVMFVMLEFHAMQIFALFYLGLPPRIESFINFSFRLAIPCMPFVRGSN